MIKRNNFWWGIHCVCAYVSVHIQRNLNIQEIILPFDKQNWNHRGVLTRTNTAFIQKLSLNYFSFVCMNSPCLQIGLACSSEPNFSSMEIVVEVAMIELQLFIQVESVERVSQPSQKPFVCCFVVNVLQPSFSTGCSFKRGGIKGKLVIEWVPVVICLPPIEKYLYLPLQKIGLEAFR